MKDKPGLAGRGHAYRRGTCPSKHEESRPSPLQRRTCLRSPPRQRAATLRAQRAAAETRQRLRTQPATQMAQSTRTPPAPVRPAHQCRHRRECPSRPEGRPRRQPPSVSQLARAHAAIVFRQALHIARTLATTQLFKKLNKVVRVSRMRHC